MVRTVQGRSRAPLPLLAVMDGLRVAQTLLHTFSFCHALSFSSYHASEYHTKPAGPAPSRQEQDQSARKTKLSREESGGGGDDSGTGGGSSDSSSSSSLVLTVLPESCFSNIETQLCKLMPHVLIPDHARDKQLTISKLRHALSLYDKLSCAHVICAAASSSQRTFCPSISLCESVLEQGLMLYRDQLAGYLDKVTKGEPLLDRSSKLLSEGGGLFSSYCQQLFRILMSFSLCLRKEGSGEPRHGILTEFANLLWRNLSKAIFDVRLSPLRLSLNSSRIDGLIVPSAEDQLPTESQKNKLLAKMYDEMFDHTFTSATSESLLMVGHALLHRALGICVVPDLFKADMFGNNNNCPTPASTSHLRLSCRFIIKAVRLDALNISAWNCLSVCALCCHNFSLAVHAAKQCLCLDSSCVALSSWLVMAFCFSTRGPVLPPSTNPVIPSHFIKTSSSSADNKKPMTSKSRHNMTDFHPSTEYAGINFPADPVLPVVNTVGRRADYDSRGCCSGGPVGGDLIMFSYIVESSLLYSPRNPILPLLVGVVVQAKISYRYDYEFPFETAVYRDRRLNHHIDPTENMLCRHNEKNEVDCSICCLYRLASSLDDWHFKPRHPPQPPLNDNNYIFTKSYGNGITESASPSSLSCPDELRIPSLSLCHEIPCSGYTKCPHKDMHHLPPCAVPTLLELSKALLSEAPIDNQDACSMKFASSCWNHSRLSCPLHSARAVPFTKTCHVSSAAEEDGTLSGDKCFCICSNRVLTAVLGEELYSWLTITNLLLHLRCYGLAQRSYSNTCLWLGLMRHVQCEQTWTVLSHTSADSAAAASAAPSTVPAAAPSAAPAAAASVAAARSAAPAVSPTTDAAARNKKTISSGHSSSKTKPNCHALTCPPLALYPGGSSDFPASSVCIDWCSEIRYLTAVMYAHDNPPSQSTHGLATKNPIYFYSASCCHKRMIISPETDVDGFCGTLTSTDGTSCNTLDEALLITDELWDSHGVGERAAVLKARIVLALHASKKTTTTTTAAAAGTRTTAIGSQGVERDLPEGEFDNNKHSPGSIRMKDGAGNSSRSSSSQDYCNERDAVTDVMTWLRPIVGCKIQCSAVSDWDGVLTEALRAWGRCLESMALWSEAADAYERALRLRYTAPLAGSLCIIVLSHLNGGFLDG
eukprot:GHVQ01003116.1.p1 GENE.GHVQ01003116.1~~GHVQ01003116.1.p1  ORF type:complete len:1158 (+),score=216.97 GHVQ01003116.1:149-3622(+)